MLIIGLTGPTGAGKGTVAEIFGRYGIPCIDADKVYHNLLLPPSELLNDLVGAFGGSILLPDGTLDRKMLASIVFSDPKALAKLNPIAHRHIMAEINRQIAQMQRKENIPAVLMDAPQLFEAKAEQECGIVISVLADEAIRLERIMRRDHISEDEARRRMGVQYNDSFFRSHSDYILENNTSPDDLYPAIRKILSEHNLLPEQNR